MKWSTETSEDVEIQKPEVLEQRFAYLDLTESGKSPLKFGEETVFVNAAILDRAYNPVNAPWLVDIDLPLQSSTDSEMVKA